MANIIFDFDGTLADSLQVIVGVFYDITGVEPVSDAEMKRMRTLPLMTIAKQLGLHWWRGPALLTKGRRLMAQRIGKVDLYPGVDQMVKDLHKDGHKLYVISSNSVHNVRKVLGRYNLEKYFEHIYGSVGLLGKGRVLKNLMKRHKMPADDCFYIGDEVRDVEGAFEAGIRCIAVAWGFSGAEAFEIIRPYALIHKPSELLPLVADKN